MRLATLTAVFTTVVPAAGGVEAPEPEAVFPVEGHADFGEADARFGAPRGGHAHEGQDVFASAGTPIRSTREGLVVEKGDDGGRGNYVAIWNARAQDVRVPAHASAHSVATGRACRGRLAHRRWAARARAGRPPAPRDTTRARHHRTAAEPASDAARARLAPLSAQQYAAGFVDQMELRNRLVMATQMWREATDDPLPRMPPGDPREQLDAFELKLIDMLCARATPQNARDVADKTWDLVHARSDDDPVKRRVVECHEVLARLSARVAGPVLGFTQREGASRAFRQPRQGALLSYLFLAGAGLGALTVLLPHSTAVMDRELLILAAIAAALAVGIYLWAGRARTWQLHTALALGTVMLTLANYYVESTVTYPLLYTWTALFAFYFFWVNAALCHVAFIGLCYAIVLAAVEPWSPVVRWLLAVGTPLVAGLLITRLLGRIRAEALDADRRADALQESEARTRLVLDGAPDAFITLDRDGVILSWNSAAERLFGWASAEAIGVPMRALIIPPEFRDRHDERRLALMDSPKVVARNASTSSYSDATAHVSRAGPPCRRSRSRASRSCPASSPTQPSGCGARRSARRSCASRPPGPRRSGSPTWSGA